MKHLLTFFFTLVISLSATAQSFTITGDTIYITASGNYMDSIVTGPSPVTYQWKVVSCNFPSDWLAASGFLDNTVARTLSSLWPSAGSYTTNPYAAGTNGTLEFAIDFSTVTTLGCFYVTARLNNVAISTDTARETFMVCHTPSLGTAIINKNSNLLIYPNPVISELYISYGEGKGYVTMTDIYGREVIRQTYTSGISTLYIQDMAKGVYFLRVYSENGESMATQKFVKE